MPSIVIPSSRPCEIDAPARFACTILRPARFTSLSFQPDKLASSKVAPDMLTFLNAQPARFTLPMVAPDMFTASKAEPEISDLCTSRHSLTPCSFMLVPPTGSPLEACDQARRIPALAAHLLHFGIELIDQ